ncbi:MAG TPA: hypothetical protein VHN37_02700 [Actinomycetota bacterium]|nr:hypothetical protein [Actinomycetota bacterium]
MVEFDTHGNDLTTGVRVDLAAGLASGRGRDVVRGLESVDGTSFDDVLTGDARANTFHPGFGDDVVRGGDGDDVMFDSIVGYWPPSGDDHYDGEEGIDTLSWVGAWEAIAADLTTGVATGNGFETLSGIEILVGSRYDDRLVGDEASNQLFGLDGSDELDARGGIDHINGGTGTDVCLNGETLAECP